MTLQHWAFSFKGRIGRRDFWAGFGVCFALFLIIISIALCLPTSVFATEMSVAQKQPSKDDIAYLKQDAPVCDFWAGFGVCFALFLGLIIINDVIYPLPTTV